jgi:hypothetical protein
MKNKTTSLLSFTLLFFIFSFTFDNRVEEKNDKAVHCFEFRVTCQGKSGFYDTVQASSWSEATKKINAKFPNCKATQVKQKDC